MSAKQIIQDNRDKLLQILLYEEYQKKCVDILNTNLLSVYENKESIKYKMSFEEWLEQILENF